MFFRQLIQDHFILGLMLLVVLGLLLGLVGVYLLMLLQALFAIAEWSMHFMGVG